MIPLALAFVLVVATAQNACPTYPSTVPIPNIANNAAIQAAFAQVDALAEQLVAQEKLPGFITMVTYGDEIIHFQGLGKNDYFNATSGPPTLDSVVRVASITKTFTGLMMYKLRDQGKLTIDDPVIKYMPKFRVRDPYRTQRGISLRQLASHSSGIQREIPCADLATCTEDQILDAVAQTFLLFPQYTKPHYSNLGVALLGQTLAKAAGVTYEKYVEEEILKPLGMTRSTFEYDKVKNDMAVGVEYYENGTAYAPVVDKLGWGNPMGGLFASPRDLAKYMALTFSRDKRADNGSQVIDGATVSEWLTPVIMMADAKSAFGTPWEFGLADGQWLESKAGDWYGYRSQIATFPPLKIGVFTCALNGEADDPTISLLTVPMMSLLIPVFNTVLQGLQPPPVLPANLANVTGMYGSGEYQLKVYAKQAQVVADFIMNNQPYASANLTQRADDIWVFRMTLLGQQNTACRWLDDGMNNEFIYFQTSSGQVHATGLELMGSTMSYNDSSSM